MDMNAQGDNPGGPVDRLLRQWGARQAVHSAEPPQCPQPEARKPEAPKAPPAEPARRRQAPAPVFSVRFLAPAAAAAMLLMAVAFCLGSMLPRNGETAADPNELAAERAELAAAEKKAESHRIEGERLQRRLEELHRDNARLQQQLIASTQPGPEVEQLETLRQELAKAEDRAGELRRLAGQSEAAAARLRAERDALEGRLKETAAELAKAQGNEDAARKLAALRQVYAEETKRLREMHDAMLARARKAEQEASLARTGQKLLLARVQAAYLKAAAPDTAGLQQRQAAARRANLLARCGMMGRLARGRNTKQTIEQLETILTRLDLLDRYDARTEAAFGSLLAESGVLAGIDAALAAAEPETVQEFLLEAKLVLEGAAGAA